MTEQKVIGGIPQTMLAVSDIVKYWGAIVGANNEGDLISWQQGTDELNVFRLNYSVGTYEHCCAVAEDFAGRDLEFVMEYCDAEF
jgi:hypothetical protein